MKNYLKRTTTFILALLMLLSVPLQAFAEVNYDNLAGDKAEIINKEKLPLKPAKPEEGKTAADLIKNPDQPEIYTLRTDYKVQRGDKYEVNYQPYIASVGDEDYTYTNEKGETKKVMTAEEKEKVDKTITLPDLAGYEKPDDDYKITYDKVKNAGNNGSQEFRYKSKANAITIKHVFQNLHDFTKYTNPDGSVGEEGQLITTQNGNTGSTMEVSPLDEKNPNRKGFVPEAPFITMQVPENAENFILEYRYNRAHYDVVFDTAGGTPVPSRTLYYEQIIPKIADESIPTKVGGIFQGWKPSHDLQTTDGKTYKANDIIKYPSGNSINNLAANLKMPAENVTFTAVWKDKPKAEYVIQFWTEKPDYDDKDNTLPLRDRYDFIGARRIDNANTGSTPDLTNLDIHGITFPDLNDGRLQKAQDDPQEFARYYFLNKDLTKEQNASEKDPNVQKSVLSNGETVYNVYYDRRVYTLYFTSINYEDPTDWDYWPIITKDGQVVGKEGDPYKASARFNQSLDKIWPKDEEVSGLPNSYNTDHTGDDGLIGWYINHNHIDYPIIFRDTPPYRLSAEDFIDAEDVMGTDDEHGNGHADEIPIADGKTKKRDKYEISLGASYMDTAMAYHIDIIKDDFNGKEQIDYDMSYWKSDTNTYDYEFILPHLQGFTLKKETRPAQLIGKIKVGDVEKTFDELNAERNKKTPFRSDDDKIEYISHFPWSQKLFDGTNAYDYANYYRNKYKLKLNNDPKTVKNDSEYGAGNILDVPYELPLNDLKLDTTHKPEKPNWVRYDWSFLGWALDPAGENLVKDGKETKLNYDQVLYAKWGEPDYKWKVIFDPNEGSLRSIDENKLTTKRKTVKEGDIGQEIETTYPIKEKGEGNKQVFTVFHKQKLVEPSFKPERKGYDFMGWEVIRYKKDAEGDYTDEIDKSYRDTYKVPELYSFGNDVVSPIYLKAIWVPNARVDIDVLHYYLDKDYNLDKNISPNPDPDKLENKRAGYLVATTGDRQDDKYTLVPHDELDEKLTGDLKTIYDEYNKRVGLNNSFFQTFRVEPAEIPDPEDSEKMIPNPDVKNNVFKFFYRPYRHREYKVNYIDERFKGEANEKDGAIIDQELVTNGNRHFDARNYRQIPGWVLTSAPQQQLFFDLNEETNELLGINGTGSDEITFYYKDVRVIEVPEGGKTPDGYVRVTFKADKGGSFTDNTGKSVTELHYDVIKGLKSDLLPVPEELGTKADGTPNDKVEGKYYITPETGKKFIKWDEKPLLNKNTIVDNDTNDFYVFTAKFEWSGLTAKGMVRTEAFNDPNGTWTNDFAPTIDELKAQLVWREKDVVKPLPTGTTIKLFDEAGKELTSDDQVYDLVNEKKAADKDEVVRTVNIKAKVTFTDGKEPQELTIPITVYKNVYEALNKEGDKPLFLTEAEGKKAEEGGLQDVTGDYVMVTIKASKDFNAKDDKIYYVNKNAWVEIPEVKTEGSSTFVNWTADKAAQNEGQAENGIFDFTKRHKFTENTVISPSDAKDVVEQKQGEDKPKVPDTFVKVIVKTTDKATDETAFEKTFWVNPSKEVTIQVDNPVGKTVDKTATEEAKAYTFTGWKSDESPERTWTNEIKGQFKNDTTIIAQYDDVKNIIPYNPDEPITRPDGYVRVKFEADDGLTLSNVKYYYVKKDAGIKLGNPTIVKPDVAAKTGYKFDKWDKDDAFEITNADITVKALSTKLDNVIPEKKDDGTPNDKPEGYKEVVFVADANGKLDGVTKFFVNPDEYVTINPPKAVGNTGYEFGSWDKDAKIPTIYKADVTTITASFNQIKDVIPKTKNDDSEKPEGYKTVTFVIEGKGGKIVDGETITYFVDPNRQVRIQPPTTNADTGYKFNAWDKDTTVLTSYAVDTTVRGSFSKFEDIIPATDDQGNENPKPDGYVTVTFDKGEHGTKIEGQRIYYVNPKANISLGNEKIVKPTVSPETGWKANGWDKEDTQPITGDLTVTAQYAPIDDVIPKTKDDESDKPEGYITVTFDKGDHGKELTGQAVYYVNPNKAVVLKDKAPTAVPNTGYKFADWDTQIAKKIQYSDGDKITALYNEIGDVIPQEKNDGSDKPAGYLTVTFLDGGHGTLTGKTVYYVKPNVEVTVPAPSVKANIGYDFKNWDKDLTQTFTEDETITAEYTSKDDIIPQKNTDGSDKPEGYVTVTFKADANGSLSGTTVYYVKPNVEVDLTNTANAIGKKADVGYTAEGGTWDKALKATFTKDAEFTFNFVKLDDVIPKTTDDESEKPEGYVIVKFIPTANAQDPTEKVYYVNPKVNVKLPIADPVGKEVTDQSGTKYKFNFKLWTVTRGTVATWDKGTQVSGVFIQDTDITAKYNVNAETLINGPVPKDNVVTGKGDVPNPEDLIKNIPGSEKDPLPDGTTFTYTNDGTPDVSKPGETTAKVEVKYPDGKTTVVEVPIKVVDHVVPQIGGENGQKPLVPDTYVKVTVDTTDKATANTKFVKVFWVKPNVEVIIPDILAPTGKAVEEDGVTKTNKFVKWQLVGSDPAKFYETEITDTFTKDETIVATYEFDKNVEPVGKNDQWIPQGSNPSPKDFIDNPYNDDDPNNPDNLPPGTKFEFLPGTEPNTSEPGTDKKTTIKVIYPNGEVKEVEVKYNVTGDVVEQPDPNDPNTKPAVPNNFVKVIVDKTENAQLQPGEQETQVFWVNPEKVVTIPVANPTGKVETKPDGTVDYSWKFTGWDNNLTQQFKEQETKITAQYKKDFGGLTPIEPIPDAYGDFIYTDYGKEVTDEQYKDAVRLPDGYSFETGTSLEIVEETKPDVNKNGRYNVSAWVKYPNGQEQLVKIIVYVGEKVVPPTPDKPDDPYYPERPYYPLRPEVRYETIIQEKVVKVPIIDNAYFKEVRYMQGFNGDFRPKDGLTRAEAAQILANALVEDGYKYNPNFKLPYKDIGEAWYTRAVKIVTEANVFEGYDDGNFKPQDKITRNEWIATLKRFQELGDASGNHMNLRDGHWAMSEIEAAYNEGWLKIYSDGLATYEGDKFIPREEVAAVSNKAFNRVLDKTYIINNDKNLISYKDVKKDMWSYEDILCASNTFLYKKDLYRAHWIKEDNNQFNINTDGFEIVKAKFQRNPR